MSGKQTALLLQMSSDDGDQRQQMVVLTDKVVFRRTVTASSRTQWRYGNVGDLPQWVSGYTQLALSSSPKPLRITHGLALMEVTADEIAEAVDQKFPRNVGLRYQRVIEAMEDAPGEWPVTEQDDVSNYISGWLALVSDGNEAGLDALTHPAGRAVTKPKAPEPAPAAEAEVEPDDNPHGWTYPPIVDGFVTRPNGQRYRVRTIGGMQDVEMLRKARLNRDHVFLWGDPGTGKTALVEAAFGTDLVTMLGTEDTEPADFVGAYTPRGADGYGWTDGTLAEAMERGVPLFVDESGVISPRTMTVVYSVMDGRDELRVTANPDRGTIKAKPGFFVILATNPHAPGVRVSEALTSRVGLSIEVGTDFAMMRTLGVPDTLVTVAENLQTRHDAGEAVWVPQARELLRAKEQYDSYGPEVAHRNLIASAPEDDREVLIEVMHRAMGGSKLKWLRL